jgi:hypothetical protein
VGLFAQGRRSRVNVSGATFKDNGIGLQIAVFGTNTLHLEASTDLSVAVDNAEFKQSGSGLGVFVTTGAVGTFENCSFFDEAKSGLASDANVTITGSKVKDCSRCGLFFFGQANVSIINCEVTENASCGIQIMGGTVNVTDGKIEFK